MQKGTEETRSKPLEQEPLLAARIVIEDCMCLLLDVDDIDRVCKNIFRGRDDDQASPGFQQALHHLLMMLSCLPGGKTCRRQSATQIRATLSIFAIVDLQQRCTLRHQQTLRRLYDEVKTGCASQNYFNWVLHKSSSEIPELLAEFNSAYRWPPYGTGEFFCWMLWRPH